MKAEELNSLCKLQSGSLAAYMFDRTFVLELSSV